MIKRFKLVLSSLVLTGIASAYACFYPTTIACATVGQYITNGGQGYYPPGCSIPTSAQVQAQGTKAGTTTTANGQQGYSAQTLNTTLVCRDVWVKIYNNCTSTYNYMYVHDPDNGDSYVPDSRSTACYN